MKFKLKGIMWEINLALRAVGSVKNEIVVKDMDDIVSYLEKYHKGISRDEVEIAVWSDREHFDGKSS